MSIDNVLPDEVSKKSLKVMDQKLVLLNNYAEFLEREYHTVKPCSPFCTVSCVHQTAMADYVREKPVEALPYFLPATHGINKALA